jgi:hypothetical protein
VRHSTGADGHVGQLGEPPQRVALRGDERFIARVRHGNRVAGPVWRSEIDGVVTFVPVIGLSRASLWPAAAPLAMGFQVSSLRDDVMP